MHITDFRQVAKCGSRFHMHMYTPAHSKLQSQPGTNLLLQVIGARDKDWAVLSSQNNVSCWFKNSEAQAQAHTYTDVHTGRGGNEMEVGGSHHGPGLWRLIVNCTEVLACKRNSQYLNQQSSDHWHSYS